jgi:outer membrane cobalamin receptor
VTFSRQAINTGYTKIDVSSAYRIHPCLAFFGRIENLLNQNYQEVLSYPAYRLNFSAGLRFHLGGER